MSMGHWNRFGANRIFVETHHPITELVHKLDRRFLKSSHPARRFDERLYYQQLLPIRLDLCFTIFRDFIARPHDHSAVLVSAN